MIMRVLALGLGISMLCPAPAKAFNASCLVSKRVMIAAAVVAAACAYKWYRKRTANPRMRFHAHLSKHGYVPTGKSDTSKLTRLQQARNAAARGKQAQLTVGCLIKDAHMQYSEYDEFVAQCNTWRDSVLFNTRKNIFDLAINNLEKRPFNNVIPSDRIRLNIASRELFNSKEMSGKFYQEVSERLCKLAYRQ